jgi:hypothetical protein
MICGCSVEIQTLHEVRHRSNLEDGAIILYLRYYSNFFRETSAADMTGKCRFCGQIHELAPRFRPGEKYRFNREKFLQYHPQYLNELFDETFSKHYGRQFKVRQVRLRHKIRSNQMTVVVRPEYCDIVE